VPEKTRNDWMLSGTTEMTEGQRKNDAPLRAVLCRVITPAAPNLVRLIDPPGGAEQLLLNRSEIDHRAVLDGGRV